MFPSKFMKYNFDSRHIIRLTHKSAFGRLLFFVYCFPFKLFKVKIFYSLLLFTITGLATFSQEFDSDLFQTLKSSSLHIFMASEKSKMEIATFRVSDENGNLEESTATYRKGAINADKINFNVRYTEHYVLEDRKRSLGNYQFSDSQILRYERTDFDNRNVRLVTYYSYFMYANSIVLRENMRTKEYSMSGSVDMDTTVYIDSVIYNVTAAEGGFKQDNLSDPGVYTHYQVANGQLISRTTYFEGFNESVQYTYDTKGHLVKIENKLTGEEGKHIDTRTEIHYDIDGLITETIFYDQDNKVLERKEFSYK